MAKKLLSMLIDRNMLKRGQCICMVDLMKRDSQIKVLIGCSEDEKQLVLQTHNNSEEMKGIVIRRSSE